MSLGKGLKAGVGPARAEGCQGRRQKTTSLRRMGLSLEGNGVRCRLGADTGPDFPFKRLALGGEQTGGRGSREGDQGLLY